MNREEAIRRLRYIRMDYLGYPPFLEPIDMAIEELSAEVNLYALPKAITVRPLTDEIAIEFLQDSGWLQKHDKEIGNPPMLVRCKDCIHWDTDSHCDSYRRAEDFCSWGERREP